MAKKKKNIKTKVIILISGLVILGIAIYFIYQFLQNTEPEPEKIYCPETQGMFCTQEYDPVCGSNGMTYGNGCKACINSEVEYYTMGSCEEIIV